MKSKLLTAALTTASFCAFISTSSAQMNTISSKVVQMPSVSSSEKWINVSKIELLGQQVAYSLDHDLRLRHLPFSQQRISKTGSHHKNDFFEFTTMFNDKLQQLIASFSKGSFSKGSARKSNAKPSKKKTCANG